MELTTLCAVVASLRLVPDRSQFFRYESVTLTCEHHRNSSQWMVRRNTKVNKVFCDGARHSQCTIPDLYPSDSGVFWCITGSGECSNAVNITVTAGSVILESPALPVMEGQAVTLFCKQSSLFFTNVTDFYKDGCLIGRSSTGNMTIHSVSKSDQGLYKCNISGAGESPSSLLSVRETGRSEPLEFTLALILLPVAVKFVLLILMISLTMQRWRKHKGESRRKRCRSLCASGPRHRPRRSVYTSPPGPSFRDRDASRRGHMIKPL